MTMTTQAAGGAPGGALAVDPASIPRGLFWFALAVVSTLPLFWFGFAGLAHGMGAARVQPRAGDPGAVASTCSCAR